MKIVNVVVLLVTLLSLPVMATDPNMPLGLIAGWDFEDQGLNFETEDVADDGLIGGDMDALVLNAAGIIWDDDAGGYVLDPTVNGGIAATATEKMTDRLKPFTMMVWVKPIDRNGDGDISDIDEVNEQWKHLLGDFPGEKSKRMFSMNSGFVGATQMTLPNATSDSLTGTNMGFDPVNIWRGGVWDPCDLNYDGTGPWHLLLWTWDGCGLLGYIDGVFHQFIWRDGGASREYAVGKKFAMGDPASPTQATKWLIDDVAYFSGYCPPESVEGLYDGTYTMHTVPLEDFPRDLDSPTCLRALPSCDSQYILPDDDPNLIGWWHFEGGTIRNVANGATTPDGEPNGTAQIVFDDPYYNWDAPYPAGYAVSTTLSDPNDPNDNNYATLGVVGTQEQLDGGFTVCAWIKPGPGNDANGDDENWIIHAGAPSDPCNVLSAGSIRMNYHDGGLRAFVDFWGDTYTESAKSVAGGWLVARGNRWNHVALSVETIRPDGYDFQNPATWNGAGHVMRLFINGALIETKDAQNFNTGPVPDVSIVPWTAGGAWRENSFDGLIDDVRIYEKPLTENELKCIMLRTCIPRLLGDLTGDCNVTIDDLKMMGADWIGSYDLYDFAPLASNWLDMDIVYPNY